MFLFLLENGRVTVSLRRKMLRRYLHLYIKYAFAARFRLKLPTTGFKTKQVTLSKRSGKFFGLSEDIEATGELLLEAVYVEFHERVNLAFSDALRLGNLVDASSSA